jgi:hypothetical protein
VTDGKCCKMAEKEDAETQEQKVKKADQAPEEKVEIA